MKPEASVGGLKEMYKRMERGGLEANRKPVAGVRSHQDIHGKVIYNREVALEGTCQTRRRMMHGVWWTGQGRAGPASINSWSSEVLRTEMY